jgi:Ser/Thr protein kinase RdoA (MazF antagonist)
MGFSMEHATLVKEIISFYSFENLDIEFIRHNENITFKITDMLHGKRYLLRIHIPVTDGFVGVQNTLEGLQSEMIFLKDLHSNNVIHVQEPVANRFGDYVTVYDTNQFGAPYFATLLTWIEGTTLTLKEDNTEGIVFILGEELAALHEFTRCYRPIQNLIRPVYDVKRIDFAITELQCGVDSGLYSTEQYEIIKEVLEIVKRQIIELDFRNNSWGLIHADLQLGNVIINNGRLSLIDFSLCGYGHYLFDLGSASSIIPTELRSAFLNGYSSKSSFTMEDLRYIEGLIFMDIFISYCFFIRDSKSNGWIKANAAEICGTLCKDFIQGKAVYYSF